MNRWQEMVRNFHRDVVKQPCSPAEPMLRNSEPRARLVAEEAIEIVVALVGVENARRVVLSQLEKVFEHCERKGGDGKPNIAEAIDGCIDTIVVCLGTLEDIGVDGDPFMEEVMRSNMAKAGGRIDEHGKLQKPAGWTPPDIEGLLARVRLDWMKQRALTDGLDVLKKICPQYPSPEAVAQAKREIAEEDERTRAHYADDARSPVVLENDRRSKLPSEHPDHICGMMCDGQDGASSYCARVREKLFGRRP